MLEFLPPENNITNIQYTLFFFFFCHEGTQGECVDIYASITSQKSSLSTTCFLLFDTISVVLVLHSVVFNSLCNIMPCTVLEYLIVSSTLSLSRGEVRKKEKKSNT